jgi:hypothetical protein
MYGGEMQGQKIPSVQLRQVKKWLCLLLLLPKLLFWIFFYPPKKYLEVRGRLIW